MLLQLLVVVVEVAKLLWQDVGVGSNVESRLAVLLLHTYCIVAHTIFAGDLMAARELINLLILVKTLVLVTFEGA